MTERINVDGISLEVAAWSGSDVNTPIMLLHEGLGSVAMWRDFPDHLREATGRSVYAYSRQGHGWSDFLSAPHKPDYMHHEGEDVLPQILDALRLSKVHLLGHSDGASIGLIAAASHPDRVDRLILEAPHVFVEDLTIQSIQKIKTAFKNTRLRARLARYHADVDHTFWSWNGIWLDPEFYRWNLEDFLAQITAPTLLIQGEDDPYGTLAQIAAIESRLPVTERLILADCGHSPHRDQTDRVLDGTVKFLNGADEGRPLSWERADG